MCKDLQSIKFGAAFLDVTKLLVDEDGDENTADHPKIELQPYGTLE